MERISKGSHEYAGKKLQAGEKFEVEPKHIGLLLTLGWIEPEEGEPGYVPPEQREIPRRARKNGAHR